MAIGEANNKTNWERKYGMLLREARKLKAQNAKLLTALEAQQKANAVFNDRLPSSVLIPGYGNWVTACNATAETIQNAKEAQ